MKQADLINIHSAFRYLIDDIEKPGMGIE